MKKKKKLPQNLRQVLWSFSWNDLDAEEDKEDVIVNVVNFGNFKQWKIIYKIYGKSTIKEVLERHLESEFNPESLNLAKLLFNITRLRHAR